MLSARGRIQREGQSEQAPEHSDVGLLDWAQHKIVGLCEEVHTNRVHSKVDEPLVFQKEPQDCREQELQPPAPGPPAAEEGTGDRAGCYLGHPQQ